MARPTKLTPEVRDNIVLALRGGNYIDTAAQYAGIDPGTFHRWMKSALEADATDDLREFRESVEKARAEAEIRNVSQIQEAATKGNWQANAWWLERSFPKRWSRVQRTELTGADGSAIEINVDSQREAATDLLSSLADRLAQEPSEEA